MNLKKNSKKLGLVNANGRLQKKHSKVSKKGLKLFYEKIFFSNITVTSINFFKIFNIYSKNFKKINRKQLESVRKELKRNLGKRDRVQVCLDPYLSITKKPSQVRMGKGKGKIVDYTCVARPGSLLFKVYYHYRSSFYSYTNRTHLLLKLSKKLSIDIFMFPSPN